MNDLDLLDQWLTHKSMNEGCSAATTSKYRGYLQRLINYLHTECGKTLLSADPDSLLEFSGLHMHKQGLGPRSRRALVASMRGFYRWAFKRKHLADDLSTHIDYPRAGQPLPEVAQLETLEKLMMAPDLDTLSGVRDCAMLAVLAGCGLRASGLVGLNESNLVWTTVDEKRRLLIRVTEKGGRERILPAPSDVWLLLRAYLGHPDLTGIDRTLEDGDRVLFVSLNNRLITPDKYHGEARRISKKTVDDMIKKYGRRMKLPEKQLHAHAFRHAFGTQMAEDGVSLREIQDLLGHANINTTQIYTRLATQRLARTVDQSNPLAKIKTPVRGLENILEK